MDIKYINVQMNYTRLASGKTDRTLSAFGCAFAERTYKAKGLNLDFYKNFLNEEEIKNILKFIKKIKFPYEYKRSNVNYGDDGLTYKLKFGKKVIVRDCECWDEIPELLYIKKKLEKLTGQKFNYVVIQRYPFGRIGIKPHRDSEVDPNTIIAGISLGETRILRMVPPKKFGYEELNIDCNSGSLYLLNPPTNTYWGHEIVPEVKKFGIRWSLTWRLSLEEN
jgi:hypothetical protein